MLTHLLILAVCAAVTVAAVRWFLIYGIEIVCARLTLSSKAKGQIIGYATSTPELVVLVSSALAGVFDAGFWNIASSNIINWVLFLSAVIAYRQQLDLFNAVFIDELTFGVLSVIAPLALLKAGVELNVVMAVHLLAFFVLYKTIDCGVNTRRENGDADRETPGSLVKGLAALIAGILVILVAGKFLGSSAHALVRQLGTPAWLVGWLLGLITSVPELASFFEVYRLHKIRDSLHLIRDTQEALDALVASNMSNLGIILPAGMIVYALVQ